MYVDWLPWLKPPVSQTFLCVDNPIKGVCVCVCIWTILFRYVWRAMLILLLVSPTPTPKPHHLITEGKKTRSSSFPDFIRPLSFHYFNCFSRSDLFIHSVCIFLLGKVVSPHPTSSVDSCLFFQMKVAIVCFFWFFVHTDAIVCSCNHQCTWLFLFYHYFDFLLRW